MAPGVRRGRSGRHTADGCCGSCCCCCCWYRRTDERCLRSRWRRTEGGGEGTSAPAAAPPGFLLLTNCLLTVGMLSLLGRCAVAAAEEKSYESSGSVSLLSDPEATAAPGHPLTGAKGEVPFSAANSDGASESEGGGLSGLPAFSSVLTVKRPVSLEHSKTLATITRDKIHTTKWPSHTASRGSEVSSLSSYVGDRILPASSGLTPSMPHQQQTTSPGFTPSRLFSMGGKKNVSSSSSSAPSSPPSFPSPTSSPEGQWIVSNLARPTQTPSLSLFRPRALQYNAHSVSQLPAAHGGVHTASKPSYFSSETTNDMQEIQKSSEQYAISTDSEFIKTPATMSYNTWYSISEGQGHFNILYEPNEMQNQGLNSDNNPKNSTSFPFNQDSKAAQMQQADEKSNPRLSSHVTQHKPNQTEYSQYKDSQTFVHTSSVTSPRTSHLLYPTVSPAVMISPTGIFLPVSPENPSHTSLSKTEFTNLTPLFSGTVSLEHASNRHDLLMAAGHGRPAVPAINKNNKIAGDGLKANSIAAPFAETRPEFATARIATTTPMLWSLNAAQKNSITQEPNGWTLLRTTFSSDGGTLSRSDSTLPVGSVHFITSKTMYDRLSNPTQTYFSPVLQSHILNNGNANEVPSLVDRPTALDRPVETAPLLPFPYQFYTTAGPVPSPDKSQRMLSSGDVPPYNKKSDSAGYGKPLTLEVQTDAGNIKSSLASPLYGNTFAENRDRKTAIDALMNGKDESALLKNNLFYTYSVPQEQSTKHFPPTLSKEEVTDDSPTSDAGLVAPILSREGDLTVTSTHERSSSWSEITMTQRTNSPSRAQGPAAFVSGNKSNFYSGTQTITASSAATTSSSFSDGQYSTETVKPIFSFGTKLMAAYTKRKASKLLSSQSSAFESEMTPSGFSGAYSNLPADGSSYERPNLEERQEHKMHILNSSDPSDLSSDSLYSTAGGDPSFSYGKGTSDHEEQSTNLSLVTDKFGSASVNSGATSVLDLSTPSTAVPHVTMESVTSSQDALLAVVYGSVAHSISLKGVTSLRELSTPVASLPMPTDMPSPSALQVSSLNMNLSTAVPSTQSSFMSPSSVSSILSSADAILSSQPAEFSISFSSLSSSPVLMDTELSQYDTDRSVVLTEAGTDELNTGTSKVFAFTFVKEIDGSLSPSQSARSTLSAGLTERTSQVPPLTPQPDTTMASAKLTTTTTTTMTVASANKTENPTTTTATTTTISMPTGTTQPTTATTYLPTTATRSSTSTTTIRTQTSRRPFTPLFPRTSPPKVATTAFISPFTTTTEAMPQLCNITERMWVKTVVSIYVRRNRLDSIQRQNLRRGLSQGLRKALNDTSAQAQLETVFGSPNMTVAYHVTGGDVVYPPSAVLEGLESYGRGKLIADLRQYLPMVTALPLPAAWWKTSPAAGFQLKTVLQFVGAGDNPRTCRFSQMMERRLERVFSEAQAKVLSTNNKLSVQMLSVTQTAGSPAVSLVYTVSNGTVLLNGTTASNLLGQLSAELVGYFLFYPPLIIAEPLEYHNLNTSVATRDFWVITVIQDVENISLVGQYQSFASLMEQRLGELFVLAGQQGTRFRRATTVGSCTVQMVSIRRVSGVKNPAEMTYYVQHNGVPVAGTSAAKVLNTVDSQTMALTLGYFVQLQAEPVVKNPPNNLWIIAAVLAPISVVTLIIIIITAVLCRKNKNDFKADAIGNLNPRAKMAYRRDVGYYHQPVQGFDYAKQHLGQHGGDEETLPASQDTLVMSLKIRDTPLSLEKALQQDGTAHKKSLSTDKLKSKLPSEDGSVISNESEKPNSGRGLTAPKVTAQQKLTKEEVRKRDDPYDTSSGSLQLISIKPVAAQPNYSHPALSDRSQDSVMVNGEVNLALKQKSDIEHYRNKLRLKAKRKGYYDFPSTDGSSSRALAQRQRHGHERAAGEHGRPLDPDDERGSTFVKSNRRHSQVGQTAYRSRQSLSSPSPGGTEMDLLVMRERPRKGIRNSGYDTEPELIEETNVDRLMGPRGYLYGRGLKGHSETSTLSSQPSIDEVRQQMHLLLEEAFSLASGGQSTTGRQSHHHHNHHPSPPDPYSPAQPSLPYADEVTSAPGTMSCGRGSLQWVPSYGADLYQCSLPKPAFRFTQLPEMALGSPPPLPPRTGPPPPGKSLRRSTSDLGPKGRSSEKSVTEMQSHLGTNPYGPSSRAALPSITADQPLSNYSGNPITAVYAIPASRSGYSEYFLSTPPTSYHSPSWMSYPPEPEDVPPQWADSLPLPGYVDAFPHPRYPQSSPTRLPLEYKQALEQPPVTPSTVSQQNLPQVAKDIDSIPLSSLSTSALVQAIRQEVAKLAKKQNEMFEF